MNKNPNILLSVQGLSRYFGGFAALSGLSFDLEPGEILGLVGPNGAGKTTVFNLITGYLKPSQGKIFFLGREITHLRTHETARLGLVRTFQLNKIFSTLTVEENIRIGCHQSEKGGFLHFLIGSPKNEQEKIEEKTERIIYQVGLDNVRRKLAEDLPYGDQKLLGIGISLGTDPKLLLLDEPFAGMNPVETKRCVAILHRIQECGTTLILVDHDMRAIMGTCKRILVLHFGKKIAEGKPEEIRKNPEVIASYLGSIHAA